MKIELQKKNKIIEEIKKIFKIYNSIIIFEYKKMKVFEFTKLRKKLKKENINIKIYKNNLVNLVIKEENNLKELNNFLNGQNAFVYGLDNGIKIIKIIYNFSKKYSNLKIKAGLYENKIINNIIIKEIANMPTKEELILIIIKILFYKIFIFIQLIKEINKKKILNKNEENKNGN